MSENGLVTAPEGTAAELAEEFAATSPESSRSRTLVWQDPVPTAAAGATMTGMEYMTAVVTGQMPPPPIAAITRDTGRVLCEARVVYRGRKQATADANLTAADSGKLLAHGIATCMLLGEG